MAGDFEALLEAEVAPLLLGELMTATYTPGDLSDEDTDRILEAWAALKYVKDQVEARLSALRDVLLVEAAENGDLTEQQGQRLYLNGTAVVRERRLSKLPSEEGLRDLMTEKGVSLDKAWTKKTVVELDPSKVANLIALGTLKGEDVEALKGVTWALRVKPSETITKVIEDAFGEEEELPDRPPRAKRSKAKGRA